MKKKNHITPATLIGMGMQSFGQSEEHPKFNKFV